MNIHFDQSQLLLVNLLIALIMFGVALDLQWKDFKAILFHSKGLVIGLLCQFLLLPACACLLSILLDLNAEFSMGLILLSSCPGGNLSNFLTGLAGGNKALSILMSGSSTLMCIFMTPLNITLWASIHPKAQGLLQQVHISAFDVAQTVLLILILPTILATGFSKRYPGLSIKLNTYLKFVSIVIFLSFVIVNSYRNIDVIKHHFNLIFWPVMLANLLGLSLGYFFSRINKLDKPQAIAVMFETGIQNAAFGLILVFNYFEANTSMAMIAAWYGIWHIISGIPLAIFLSKVKVK
jgi:BASS family bile acid:Na+ symporter